MKDKCNEVRGHPHKRESLDVLSAAGLKRTPLRLAILDVFHERKTNTPCSQKELIELLTAKTDVEVDRVSVYRNVRQYLELGIIHEVEKNAYVTCHHLHEAWSTTHVLMYCQSCARHKEVCEQSEKEFFAYLTGRAGFFSRQGQLQVSGVCRDCAANPR